MDKTYRQETSDSSEKKNFSAPRFLEKWLIIFDPWVTRSKDDPNRPFCKACQTSLDCNRAHLQRHERTSKHGRNLKIFLENGEQAALENFQLRQERNKYYIQRKMKQMDKDNANEQLDYASSAEGEYIVGEGIEDESAIEYVNTDISRYNDQYERKPIVKQAMQSAKTPPKINKAISRKNSSVSAQSKKDRLKLFMQIQKDKNDLMKTFQSLVRSNNKVQAQSSPPQPTPQTLEKNHVDLFFESVSSTVKNLSPKLIAEAKMRVQQLICELELRELTNSNTNDTSGNASTGTIVVSPSSGNSYVLQTNTQTKQS